MGYTATPIIFWSLQHFLDSETFTSNKEVKNNLDQFFASREQNIYELGIILLPERRYWTRRDNILFNEIFVHYKKIVLHFHKTKTKLLSKQPIVRMIQTQKAPWVR